MTARPVVSVDARLAEIEQLAREIAELRRVNRMRCDEVQISTFRALNAEAQLRDARAENERLRAAYQTVCGYAETVDKVTAERDDLRTRLAAAEQGRRDRQTVTLARIISRAHEALAAEQDEPTESIVCMDYPNCDRVHAGGAGGVPVHPPAGSRVSGCDGPLVPFEQDEPKWCEHGFSEAHDFGFMASQWCPGPVSQPTEPHDEPERCEHGVSYAHVIDRTDGYNFPEMNCPGPVSQPTEGSEQ